MLHEHSSGAVIFFRNKNNDGRVEYLILSHSEKYWNFPKGKLEKGESDFTAAKREVKEETGIERLNFMPSFKVSEKYFFSAPIKPLRKPFGGKPFGSTPKAFGVSLRADGLKQAIRKRDVIFKTVNFYLAEAYDKNIKISKEHQDFKWLSYEEALDLVTFENSKEVLKKANDFLAGFTKK